MSGPVPRVASFSVDVEQDCPPYRSTFRGIEEGMPKLLALLAARGIRGTFFTTGEVARKFPDAIRAVVTAGHELGCHGDWHRDFTTLTPEEARRELRDASATLRAFGPVTSFRAPYLRFPQAGLPWLVEHGYTLDSSQARYKGGPHHRADAPVPPGLRRVPASTTSSVLRLPRWLRQPVLDALASPVVLFVHPWEFVDFRGSDLRLDCRFRTGQPALDCVGAVLDRYLARGYDFVPMAQLP